MLKRLELVGFKSFADKTRLDFDPGISAIVGPNGSGKSNIVDAIRWILGEQSAKSLRGKEMADCIFNGSGTRRSLGMAEVSIVLDNTQRYLPADADEVVLTRRVYRSGEGEYLINGQVARLRDIKDLFLGTGAGHHAYSIIEQGKVDQILQSSTKDRRFIFEEAAGISRFKARKIEALKRLERVAQNLVRVQDIKEEIDKQLRSLRSQATRAKRFRELSDRFKLLRLQQGRDEYTRYADEIAQISSHAGPLEGRVQITRQDLEQDEQRLAQVEQQIGQLEAFVAEITGRLSNVRAQMATLDSEISAEQVRDGELSDESLALGRQWAAGQQRERLLETSLTDARHRHQEALAEKETHLERGRQSQDRYASLSEQVEQLQKIMEEHRTEHEGCLAQIYRLENEQSALDGQSSFQWQQHDRLEEAIRVAHESLTAWRVHEASLFEQDQAIKSQLRLFLDQATTIEGQHQALLAEKTQWQEDLALARQEKIAVDSRRDVLEQLLARHEGLDAGVRAILAERADHQALHWQPILGVLAEQIDVAPEFADIVELALGSRAQSLVVRSLEDLDTELLDRARQLPGRVHFLAIEDPPSERMVLSEETLQWPTLASLVECDPTIRPLVDRLLGQTFLADDFAAARALGSPSFDWRFVTRQGDIIEPDGSVGTGPPNKTSGIIARSAERRTLLELADHWDRKVKAFQHKVDAVDIHLRQIEQQLGQQQIRRSTLGEQARHIDIVLRQTHDRIQSLEVQWISHRGEFDRTREEIAETERSYRQIERQLAQMHDHAKEASQSQIAAQKERDAHESEFRSLSEMMQQSRTLLAVIDERIQSIRNEEQKLLAELDSQRVEVDALAGRVRTNQFRRQETSIHLLDSRARLAYLFQSKDQIHRELGDFPEELLARREERKRLSESLFERRRSLAEDQATLHQSQLRLTELRFKSDSLTARLAEDYGVDLAVAGASMAERVDLPDEEIATEIEDLRDKLARLGSVNSEAVAELDDLEQRAATFELQLADLAAAQKHLDQLIGRINDECKRMFVDSFDTIRFHFQELFRKLFGGGKADIVLEDESDVLESGIEIVARPPGKEPQSISLLSGGEKTMTAVALVMAIFRAKPSPFCILDEVDAALDEANIGRFVQLLREYTNLSQFILITHSKTTMAAADVLHGITQRESGVSIRVSVRLEDVTDDGHILDREDESSDSAA
ncbi:chromosome segregation protein SMC [bacterium]|nr:chromosome segregation protein SMC [bacterium]